MTLSSYISQWRYVGHTHEVLTDTNGNVASIRVTGREHDQENPFIYHSLANT